MTVQISRSREKLSSQKIAAIERKLSLSLPSQYRAFLLTYNGGRPRPKRFPIGDDSFSSHGQVHFFLCVKEGDSYNLEDWVTDYYDRIPSGFLPIAVDPGGNLICLAIAGDNAGKVYFWDHEEEVEEGQTPGYENVYLIANSFHEFLNCLSD